MKLRELLRDVDLRSARNVTLRLGSVIPSVSEGSGGLGVAKNVQSLTRPSRFLAHARNDSAEAAR